MATVGRTVTAWAAALLLACGGDPRPPPAAPMEDAPSGAEPQLAEPRLAEPQLAEPQAGRTVEPELTAEPESEAAAEPEPVVLEDAELPSPTRLSRALAAVFRERLTVRRRADGTRVLSRHCRDGPVPCDERLEVFAALIVRAARAHRIDVSLLAALSLRESGLDPSAVGRRGEAGLVQLHPRGVGRGMRYVLDPAYRNACQARVDACQGPVLDAGAEALAGAIRRCGGIRAGLGAYASGRCRRFGRHPRNVLAERDRVRGRLRQLGALR